jgi:adenylate cyclase
MPSETTRRSVGTVTVLFTDVVGSTELLDKFGDDVADRVRRKHFKRLRQLVRAFGGTEVKSLGDGLMVAFTAAADAVACALAMQRAVAAGEHPLDLRIGIAAGEAVPEDGDYFGRPVVVARRLCDAAAGGEVLVSAPTPELAADRVGHEVRPLGRLALKGLREPVSAAMLRPRPLALSA